MSFVKAPFALGRWIVSIIIGVAIGDEAGWWDSFTSLKVWEA